MLWAALLLPPGPDGAPPSDEALRGVATWALQFTPRVATSEEAVLLELEASARLFGGVLPKFWGLYLAHNHTGALAASQSGIWSYYGVKYDIT